MKYGFPIECADPELFIDDIYYMMAGITVEWLGVPTIVDIHLS